MIVSKFKTLKNLSNETRNNQIEPPRLKIFNPSNSAIHFFPSLNIAT